MRLSDIYSKPMKQVLEEECEVVDQKIHTDEAGNIKAIEVKYHPKISNTDDYTDDYKNFELKTR